MSWQFHHSINAIKYVMFALLFLFGFVVMLYVWFFACHTPSSHFNYNHTDGIRRSNSSWFFGVTSCHVTCYVMSSPVRLSFGRAPHLTCDQRNLTHRQRADLWFDADATESTPEAHINIHTIARCNRYHHFIIFDRQHHGRNDVQWMPYV